VLEVRAPRGERRDDLRVGIEPERVEARGVEPARVTAVRAEETRISACQDSGAPRRPGTAGGNVRGRGGAHVLASGSPT